MSLVVRPGQFEGRELTSVLLVLEPVAGGDLRLDADGVRVVEQVKIRTNGQAWTAGQVVDEVLPDLLLAVGADFQPTKFLFSTNGEIDCGELTRLCSRLKGRLIPEDVLSGLDDQDERAFKYGAWMSERRYFERLAKRANCTDFGRFWVLLASFEIEGDLHDAAICDDIDRFLGDIVDAHEDVSGKRDQLVGLMMKLGHVDKGQPQLN